MVCGRRPPSRWSWSSTFGACRTTSRVSVVTPPILPPMRTFTTLDDVAAAAGQELGTQRVADRRPGAGRPVRRRDRRPPVDPRRRGAGGGGAVRRHHRPRLPHPQPAAALRARGVPPRDAGRPAQLRPREGAVPRTGPGRQPAPLTRALRRGHRPPLRQAADRAPHGRDRGPRRSVARASRPASPPTSSLLLRVESPSGRARLATRPLAGNSTRGSPDGDGHGPAALLAVRGEAEPLRGSGPRCRRRP